MRSVTALALGLFAAWSGLCAPGEQSQSGAPVSEFQLLDLQGGAHSFSLKGDVTVVLFLAARCPISDAYSQRMQALYQDFSPQGVKFLFINANFNEPSQEVARHAKQMGFTFPVYRDSGNVAEMFDAQVTPMTFVVDAQGVVRYRGAIDDAQNEARVKKNSLRNALGEVLAGKPVTVGETKAFGCTVKRARRRTTD